MPKSPPDAESLLGTDPMVAEFESLVEDFFETGLGVGGALETEAGEDGGCQIVVEGAAAVELRATFGGIAAQHMLPVRQFHRRLVDGPVSTDWLGLCRPAVATVGRTAVEMGLVDLVRPLDQLAALFSSAERQGGQAIEGESRDALLQACGHLVELFPEAFEGEDDPDAREGVIVHAVLRQIPRVGTVSLDKIFAAGFTSMGMLTQASAEDLVATTGISPFLAEQVRRAVERYQEQTSDWRQGGAPGRVVEALHAAMDELAHHDAAFRATPQTRDGSRQRKVHRQSCRLAHLRAETWLATLGEVRLVEELQRLPRDRVLERLHVALSSFVRPEAEPVSAPDAAVLPQE